MESTFVLVYTHNEGKEVGLLMFCVVSPCEVEFDG
jgi:hypothetical protein